ncbi:MAG: SRPBCC family protein [Myxococcota bacterium]
MTQRSTEHATFDIERFYDASPARVFGAWAEPAAKAQWFGPSADSPVKLELDFRVDGREHFMEAMPDGRVFGYDARYQEIVPGQRIVYVYTVDFDKTRISASLATVEISPAGERTRLLYTEQAAYLDGLDTPADRERGTRKEFEKLALALSPA